MPNAPGTAPKGVGKKGDDASASTADRWYLMLYKGQGINGCYGIRDKQSGKQIMQVNIKGATREENMGVAEKVVQELQKGLKEEDAKELCRQLKEAKAAKINKTSCS